MLSFRLRLLNRLPFSLADVFRPRGLRPLLKLFPLHGPGWAVQPSLPAPYFLGGTRGSSLQIRLDLPLSLFPSRTLSGPAVGAAAQVVPAASVLPSFGSPFLPPGVPWVFPAGRADAAHSPFSLRGRLPVRRAGAAAQAVPAVSVQPSFWPPFLPPGVPWVFPCWSSWRCPFPFFPRGRFPVRRSGAAAQAVPAVSVQPSFCAPSSFLLGSHGSSLLVELALPHFPFSLADAFRSGGLGPLLKLFPVQGLDLLQSWFALPFCALSFPYRQVRRFQIRVENRFALLPDKRAVFC